MTRINQAGIAQILVLVLLLGGVVAGTYLVQQRTNLLPKAFQPWGSACQAGVKQFSLGESCQGDEDDEKEPRYKGASFTCLDGHSGELTRQTGKGKGDCKGEQFWRRLAERECRRHQVCEGTPSAKPKPTEATSGACTPDAKQCPDGSLVGRVGPKCEFAQCPEGTEDEDKASDNNESDNDDKDPQKR